MQTTSQLQQALSILVERSLFGLIGEAGFGFCLPNFH